MKLSLELIERAVNTANLEPHERELLRAALAQQTPTVTAAAEALLSRDDFWKNAGTLPGEYDDLVDALAQQAQPTEQRGALLPMPGTALQQAQQCDHGADYKQCKADGCPGPVQAQPQAALADEIAAWVEHDDADDIMQACELLSRAATALRGKPGMPTREKIAVCKWGHPFTPENTIQRKEGWRECRACKRAKNKEQKARMRPIKDKSR